MPKEIAKELVALVDGTSADIPVDGNLIEKSKDRQLDFGFEYLGIPFVVRAEGRDQGTDMEIRANLGNLPFTAEDPERRRTALSILNAASADLGGRIQLSTDQSVVMTEKFRLDEPLTPVVLLSRVARIVLRHKPYLQLLTLVIAPPIHHTRYGAGPIH